MFAINTSLKKTVLVLDNFYENPMEVRKFALNQTFSEDISWYKGLRTKEQFLFSGLKETFETRIGHNISLWEDHQYNGCFQITTSEDRQVYHCDENSWAGVLYLTPGAPLHSGTRLHKSNLVNKMDQDDMSEIQSKTCFSYGFYDSTKFDTVDVIGNVFNRLVLFKSTIIHSAGEYFGNTKQNGRLVQLFFFN
tara:strand:+ start:792 stop:1370 length:579 start_codon:yes stop_codon:yes gene_type:complete